MKKWSRWESFLFSFQMTDNLWGNILFWLNRHMFEIRLQLAWFLLGNRPTILGWTFVDEELNTDNNPNCLLTNCTFKYENGLPIHVLRREW